MGFKEKQIAKLQNVSHSLGITTVLIAKKNQCKMLNHGGTAYIRHDRRTKRKNQGKIKKKKNNTSESFSHAPQKHTHHGHFLAVSSSLSLITFDLHFI